MSEPVLLERRNQIAFVRLNRPDQGHALDLEMPAAIMLVIDTVAEGADLSAVLMEAAKQRVGIRGAVRVDTLSRNSP